MSLTDETGGVLVMQVAPLSTKEIEARATRVLDALVPGFVGQAKPLDVIELVDHVLPQHRIHFVPIADHQLPDMWAFAQADGEPGDEIEVLVKNTEWQNLFRGGRGAHHARGTFMHELGHCILHVDQLRRRRALGLGLPRQRRVAEMKTFQSAEWQAWAMGGCLLAPRASIAVAPIKTVEALAYTFSTSVQLMQLHLMRLGVSAPGDARSRTGEYNRGGR